MDVPEKLDFRTRILNQLKGIIFHHLSSEIASIYLFGSWARGDEKKSSDIDIAIEFRSNQDKNPDILMLIRDQLEESTLPYKVDIVHLNAADEIIISKVRKEGIRWVEPMKE